MEPQSSNEQQANISERFVNTIVNRPQVLNAVLRGNMGVRETISTQIANIPDEEVQGLTRTILDSAGSPDSIKWTQEKREGALEILKLIPPETRDKVNKTVLLNDYTSVLLVQNRSSALEGPIALLGQAGNIVASFLKPETAFEYDQIVAQVESAWRQTASHFHSGRKALFDEHIATFVRGLVKPIDISKDIEPQESKNEPEFPDREQELWDKYKEIVKRDRTFKRALWDATPEFQAKVGEYGINLAQFWNLNDVGLVSLSFQRLADEGSQASKDLFRRAWRRTGGLTLDQITPEYAEVLADEIMRTVQDTQVRQDTGSSFLSTIDGLEQRIVAAKQKPVRNMRAVLAPIQAFLKQNGLPDQITDLDSAEAILKDPEKRALLQEGFSSRSNTRTQKQEEQSQAAEYLSQIFHLDSVVDLSKYSLITRDYDDLFQGDLANDCTAMTPQPGINYWTVPIWLFNPGFTIFMNREGKLLSKAGLLLSVTDGEPSLTIDSLESGTTIRPEEEEDAKRKIIDGIHFIKDWASEMGLSTTYAYTYSNSEELRPVLEENTMSDEKESYEAMGGFNGIVEVRRNLCGRAMAERIYLQAASKEDEGDYYDIKRITDFPDLLADMEQFINRTKRALQDPDEQRIFQEAVEAGEWNKIYPEILKSLYPRVHETLKDLMARHENLFDIMEVTRLTGTDNDPATVVINTEDQKTDLGELLGRLSDEDEDMKKRREAELSVEFFSMLQDIRTEDFTPQDLLRELYQSISSTESDKLELKLDLPVVV